MQTLKFIIVIHSFIWARGEFDSETVFGLQHTVLKISSLNWQVIFPINQRTNPLQRLFETMYNQNQSQNHLLISLISLFNLIIVFWNSKLFNYKSYAAVVFENLISSHVFFSFYFWSVKRFCLTFSFVSQIQMVENGEKNQHWELMCVLVNFSHRQTVKIFIWIHWFFFTQLFAFP